MRASGVPAVKAAIALGTSAVQQFDGYDQLRSGLDESDEGTGRDDDATVAARLLAVAAGAPTFLRPGEAVPYVKLTRQPTIGETARLWTLNDKQVSIICRNAVTTTTIRSL